MKHLFRKYLKVALLFSNLNACMGAETSLFSNLPTEIVEHIGEYVAGPISKDGAINLTDWNALYQTSKKNCKSLQRQEKKYIDAKAQQYTTKAFKFYRTVLNTYLYPKDKAQKKYLYLKYQDIFDTFASVPVNEENKVKKGLVFDTIKEKIKTPLETLLLNSAWIIYNRYPEIIKYPEYKHTIFLAYFIKETLKDPALGPNLFTICTNERGETVRRLKNLREIFNLKPFKNIHFRFFTEAEKAFSQEISRGFFEEINCDFFKDIYSKSSKNINHQSFKELNLGNPSFFPELTKKEENIEADKMFIVNFQKILKSFKQFKSRTKETFNILKLESMKEFYSSWLENWIDSYTNKDVSYVSQKKKEIENLNLANSEFLEELKKYTEQEEVLNKNKNKIEDIFENLADKLESLEELCDKDLKSKLKEIGQTIDEQSQRQGMRNIIKEKYIYNSIKSKIEDMIDIKVLEIIMNLYEVSFYNSKVFRIENALSILNKNPATFSKETDQIAKDIEKLNQEITTLPLDLMMFIKGNVFDIPCEDPRFKIRMDFCNDPLRKNAMVQKMQAIIYQWNQYCKNNSHIR